jgi:periplasmic protein TonB
LVKPPYPPAAKAVRASGAVNVQVTIDENGNVISASAVSGHALLRGAAESAARASKFSPTMLSGQKVKVTGGELSAIACNYKFFLIFGG